MVKIPKILIVWHSTKMPSCFVGDYAANNCLGGDDNQQLSQMCLDSYESHRTDDWCQ